jgi:hypothetical protein
MDVQKTLNYSLKCLKMFCNKIAKCFIEKCVTYFAKDLINVLQNIDQKPSSVQQVRFLFLVDAFQKHSSETKIELAGSSLFLTNVLQNICSK